MRQIIVQIDNLVLRGVRHEDRHEISAGLQEELSRLLALPEAALQLDLASGLPDLNAGPLKVYSGSKPQDIGKAAAQGIVKGFFSR